jgi:transposase
MEAITERCCGLDVHQATVVACVLVGKADRKPKKQIKTFQTVTKDLVALRDWLKSKKVTHVAMESTGVYWMPVYNVLEDYFEVIVGNAQHMKNVPGRKTDVCDAEWIADLLRHGLIRPSFVPPRPIRHLRDLVRYRTKLIQSQTAERNRLLKQLEIANIKLASFMSDVFGVSGQRMLHALIAGKTDLLEIARLAKGRLRSKIPLLTQALDGKLDDHHKFILSTQIRRLDQLKQDIEAVQLRIDEAIEPYRPAVELLKTIPGVDEVVAAAIVAEIGVDMSVFLSAHHLASWAGVCPGNNESAGKRRRTKVRKGNRHLRAMLVQAGLAASKTKGTYLRSKYYSLRARRGPKRAVMAIGHKIIIAAHHILSTNTPFQELGDAYLDKRSEQRLQRSLVRRLERLGFDVQLTKNDDTAAEEQSPMILSM